MAFFNASNPTDRQYPITLLHTIFHSGLKMVQCRHGVVATIVVRQIFNEDKNLSQQIHEDKRQKDKC